MDYIAVKDLKSPLLVREKLAQYGEVLVTNNGRPMAVMVPVADGEAAALKLWTEAGVRVLPGAYLGRDAGQGNPGAGYIRVAMVAPKDDMQRGLIRLRDCLYA